jgi:hypothetical protein
MIHHSIAIVPDTPLLSLADVLPVAAAINKQIARDFAPLWHVGATVAAFANRDSVPHSYWPIFVGAEGQGGGGVHEDANKQPFALVDFTSDWSVTASHECMEMLGDPFGNRLHTGHSIDPEYPHPVRYLVEVCDPPEALSYDIDGVQVSNFLTPHYYDARTKPGVHYDFMARIPAPLTLIDGGYISWMQPSTGIWRQKFFFGGQQSFKTLGRFDNSFGSLRSWIDSMQEEAN